MHLSLDEIVDQARDYDEIEALALLNPGCVQRHHDWEILHHVVLFGNVDLARKLIGKGVPHAHINQTLEWGATALSMAVCMRNFEMCKLLVASGADVNAVIIPTYYKRETVEYLRGVVQKVALEKLEKFQSLSSLRLRLSS